MAVFFPSLFSSPLPLLPPPPHTPNPPPVVLFLLLLLLLLSFGQRRRANDGATGKMKIEDFLLDVNGEKIH